MSSPPPRAASSRLVVDVEGARDVGPSEASGLIRECLALAHKRYDTAIWRALNELESPIPADAEPRKDGTEEPEAVRVARTVRRDRSKVVPRFRAEFDRLFQARREGKPRVREQLGAPDTALALVGEGEQTGQVALKNAVQAMLAATRESGFGFDLRTRMVMRENAESGEYDNPWGATLLCDALGNACRGLWGGTGVWRPIMEHLVRALTPELVALHAELDHLLQDRDVLPVLRVRTRKRGAAAGVAGPADLFGKIADMFGEPPPGPHGPTAQVPVAFPGSPVPMQQPSAGGFAAPPAMPGRAGTDPLDFGDAGAWHVPPPPRGGPIGGYAYSASGQGAVASSPWQALERALAVLQSASGTPATGGAADFDPVALHQGAGNVLPVIDATVAASGDPPLPRAIVEVVSAALDEVFENPYLPAEVKIVFGRLQIPLLKAALRDRDTIADPRHPARRFFDALAAASVGVRPEVAADALFVELASHLVAVVRDAAGDEGDPFERARDELEAFLDAERAAYNQKLAQALPALLALDEDAEARNRARTTLSIRVGHRAVAPEVRDFLDHECVDRLSTAYRTGGPEADDARQTLELVDELLWSIDPDHVPGARRRLLLLIPRLVRAIGEMWPPDDATRVRRKVFLARLYELHVEAMRTAVDLPPAEDDVDPTPSRMRVPIPDTPPAAERDEAAESVDALLRGDWCAFEGEDDDGTKLVAKLAWRSPHGSQILFSHRDGSIALIHTPQSLARAFRDGKAKVAVEAVPLFERAMEKLLEKRGDLPADGRVRV